MVRRILYIQFTDPAAYPPIEHSSRFLAERGWDVSLLGTHAFLDQEFNLPSHPRIRIRRLRFVHARWKKKLQYFWFLFWTLYWTLAWRPGWIYASDPLSSPVVWLIRRLTKVYVVYHEHDSPNRDETHSLFMRAVSCCRAMLGKDAELCILPQRERLLEFLKETQRSLPAFCVWNCPRLCDVQENKSSDDQKLIIYYHGSITSSRLPDCLVVAASRFKGAVRLRVAGYETPGSIGRLRELMHLSAENGVADLIDSIGTVTFRSDLLSGASEAHVGLSLMPKCSQDINLQHMVGASNKPFDCMACGLPLLVTDLPDWISTFVEPGYARACDPNDADSIETELRWYLDHPMERREMGRRCREKIRLDWNYDTGFAPIVAHLEKR